MGQPFLIVFGGDARLRYAAQGFVERGFRCLDLPDAGADDLPLLQQADLLLLPVPALRGETINGTSLSYDQVLCAAGDALLYGGRLPSTNPRVIDYAELEAFQQANAIPTAEGAIQLLMEELPITLMGARILLIGFGRIGKALAVRLRDLGAQLTVSARKEADFAGIWALGLPAEQTHLYSAGLSYDCIINTVPAQVLSAEQLWQVPKDCYLLDLASLPGGIDPALCKTLGLRCRHAPGLPGQTSPKTAGLIIRDVVLEHSIQHQKGC